MSKQRKQQKKKKKVVKKRAWQSSGVSKSTFNKMTRDHPDVLQNIEFCLAAGYHADPTVDDCAARDAVMALVYEKEIADPRVQSLVDGLKQIRQMRGDVSDSVWRDALRVVLQSIHNHSYLTTGATRYLDFISKYVGTANRE